MQRFHSILGALAIALLCSLAFASVVRAQDFPYKAAGSVRVLAPGFPTSPLVGTVQGRGALGQFVQDYYVAQVPGGNPDACEEGEGVVNTITGFNLTTTYKDLSQYLAGGHGVLCVNPNTGAGHGFVSGFVFGVTGRFEGRTGTLEATFTIPSPSVFVMSSIAVEGKLTLE